MKIGDKVRVINKDDSFYGCKGVIVDKGSPSFDWFVKIDGYGEESYNSCELTLDKETKFKNLMKLYESQRCKSRDGV